VGLDHPETEMGGQRPLTLPSPPMGERDSGRFDLP